MKINRFFGFVFMILLFSSSVIAIDSSYIFKRNTDIDLKISCFDENYYECGDLVNCSITINNPDGSNLIKNGEMSNNIDYFNISIQKEDLTETGEYNAIMVCESTNTSGFSTFIFEVTPNGIRPSEGNSLALTSSVIILILIVLVCVYLTRFFAERQSGLSEFFFIGIFIFTAAALKISSVLTNNMIAYNSLMTVYRVILYSLFFLFFVILIRLTMRAVKQKSVKDRETDQYEDNIY